MRVIESAVLAMASGPSSATIGAINCVTKLKICCISNENHCSYSEVLSSPCLSCLSGPKTGRKEMRVSVCHSPSSLRHCSWLQQ